MGLMERSNYGLNKALQQRRVETHAAETVFIYLTTSPRRYGRLFVTYALLLTSVS